MPTKSSPLVSAKFSPPAFNLRQVVREDLTDDIVDTAARLVLVRAPAGFGKTTVMAQARHRLEREGIATAWLTLDAADNDPARLLAYLGHVLDELAPKEHAGAPDGGATALGEAAIALMEGLSAIPFPFALFVDEFEALHAAGVTALFAQLIERLPPGSKLVIGSRSIPDLRIARLRAGGQLLELDIQQLRFSLEETRNFFAERGARGVGADEVALLHRKTEGWVVALWLAWLALERHQRPSDFIASFSGMERSVAEYLAEEVLSQQPEDARRLLLASSILREISAPLCDMLLPGVPTARLLEQLSTANVFLVPIEGKPGYWRYHSLFASFLRAQLQREMPGELNRLHLAAAGWFLAQGRPVPAVDHYIEAGESGEAIAVLRKEAMPLLMQGRLRLLARWFDALPAEALTAEPLLQVAQIWSECFTGGPQTALAMMRKSGIEQSDDLEIRVHVAGLHASLLALMDQWDEAHAVASRSLHLLPSPSAFANASLVNVSASAATVLGLFPEARQFLRRAREGQALGSSAFHRMYSETTEGIIDLIEGRLSEPRARFRLAVQTTQASSLDAAHGNAWAGLLYAGTVYESGDPQQARRLLQMYLPLARDAWLSDHVIVGYRILARIAFAEGEIDHGFQSLSELEYLGHERQLPRLAAAARVERARMLLLQGHANAAAEELRSAGTPELWRQIAARCHLGHDAEDQLIGQMRWQLQAGDPRKAAMALDALVAQATRDGRLRRALKLRLLQAMALHRAGEDDQAHALALPLLQLCCAEDLFRVVLDEGPVAGRLVLLVQSRLEAQPGGQGGPIFADYLQRLVNAFGPIAGEGQMAGGTAPLPELVEALTPKEIRLLQLLAEGYSNRALTEKLFVTDSTVRTHLRNINGKLGANNRTQAVAMARRFKLID